MQPPSSRTRACVAAAPAAGKPMRVTERSWRLWRARCATPTSDMSHVHSQTMLWLISKHASSGHASATARSAASDRQWTVSETSEPQCATMLANMGVERPTKCSLRCQLMA